MQDQDMFKSPPNVGKKLMSLRSHTKQVRDLGISDEYGTHAPQEVWGWVHGEHVIYARVARRKAGWRARQVWSHSPTGSQNPASGNVLKIALGFIRDGVQPALKLRPPSINIE